MPGGRPLRVTTATTKVGVVLTGFLLTVFGALTAAAATESTGAGAVAVAVAVVVVLGTAVTAVVAGRTFRAAGEPVPPPRPWWRLTGGRTSGSVVAGVFGLEVVSLLTSSPVGPEEGLVVSSSTFWAAAYLHSALRTPRSTDRRG